MTILLKGERHGHQLTGTGNDTVITGFELPAESVLRSLHVNVDMIGVQTALERERCVMYACAAYLIQLDDPDEAVTHQTIWDTFVPKYTDTDTIDLSTGEANATPFWEPGMADFDDLFEMGDRPLKLFMRRKKLNFANPGSGGIRFQPAETPFEPQWMPADSFRIHINRPIRIRSPSALLVAISNPLTTDTTTTRPILTESEWGQIQYIESTLERSLMDQLGVTEAGAETPWTESTDLLRKHLAPDVQEETAGAFATESFNVFQTTQFSHTVPGTMSFRTVDITP